MGVFQEVFEAYGGDYAATMARFVGSERMYMKLLDMFFEDKSVQALERSLQAGDLASAFEAAHSLKGVAGNMGLTPLYQAVCAIVDPLRVQRGGEDYPALLQEIQNQFQVARLLREDLEKAVS